MTDAIDLKDGSFQLLTYWLPADEADRREHVREVLDRLWDKGLHGMLGSACSLAGALHLLNPRVRSFLHLSGFEKDVGMIGLVCSVDNGLILPGCLALWGDATMPESVMLTPAELQDDLSLAKPAGASMTTLAKVTPAMLKNVVASLIELADGIPAGQEPKAKRPWWRSWWGKPGSVN